MSAGWLGAPLLLSACSTVVIEERATGGETAPEAAPPAEVCAKVSASLSAPHSPPSGVDVYAAAAGPDCSAFAAGSYFGAPDLGGGVMPAAADWDGWVSRFDAEGRAIWTRRLIGSVSDWSGVASHIVADASGDA